MTEYFTKQKDIEDTGRSESEKYTATTEADVEIVQQEKGTVEKEDASTVSSEKMSKSLKDTSSFGCYKNKVIPQARSGESGTALISRTVVAAFWSNAAKFYFVVQHLKN